MDVHGIDEAGFKRITSLIALLFSVGALAGLVCQKWLFSMIGRLRLIFVMELCHIVIALLYLIESLNLFIILRVLAGVVGGLSLGVIPVVLRDIFPVDKASRGCTIGYFIMTVFFLIGSLQNFIFGGRQGLKAN